MKNFSGWGSAVLHPFLFVLFPILSLFTSNLGQLKAGVVVRPALVALVGAGAVLFIFRIVFRNWQNAGLGTSLAVLLFYTFGPLQHWLSSILYNTPIEWVSAGSGAAWLGLFGLGIWGITRVKGGLNKLTVLLNQVGGVALLACLWGAGVYAAQLLKTDSAAVIAEAQSLDSSFDRLLLPARTSRAAPDIYWIVLDGYARADVLKEIYGVDNGDFNSYLERRGFYLAAQAHSNYAQTALSLSSTLNMNYLDQLASLDKDSYDREILDKLINNSRLVQILKENGYQTIAFAHGYQDGLMSSADVFLERGGEQAIFENTVLANALGDGPQVDGLREEYRQGILWQVGQVKRLAGEVSPRPRFIYAHLLLPHPPFMFPPDPEARPAFVLNDGSHFLGTREEYIEGYARQLLYTNELAQEMIDAILDGPGSEPVIILQSDHGPGSHLDWRSFENTCVRERLSILNAYYFPDGDYSSLAQDITPVNSFRIILNRFFGSNLALLPDHSFFSIWDRPYGFYDAGERLEDRCED